MDIFVRLVIYCLFFSTSLCEKPLVCKLPQNEKYKNKDTENEKATPLNITAVLNLKTTFTKIRNHQREEINLYQTRINILKDSIEGFITSAIKPCVHGRSSYENGLLSCSCDPAYSGDLCEKDRIYSNCTSAYQAGGKNGVYFIQFQEVAEPVQIYCDFLGQGGAWMSIQRRINGSLDFYRNWKEYQNGFGRPDENYWMGLDLLNSLTSNSFYRLRIDIEDWDGKTAYTTYRNFMIEDLSSNYKIHLKGSYGSAGNAMKLDDQQPFSTPDRDNDNNSNNCAEIRHGAWWYSSNCTEANLNGRYFNSGVINSTGVFWHSWKTSFYSLKKVEMKIRSKTAEPLV